MSPLLGLLHVVLVVLIASGSLKLVRPAAASNAMIAARILPIRWRRQRNLLARLLGLVEIGLGVSGLVVGAPLRLALAAALYASFNLFLFRLQRVSNGADCGCMGASSQPAGPAHYWMNLIAAAVCGLAAFVAASGTDVSIARIATLGAFTIVCYWALVLVTAWLVAAGPALLSALSPKALTTP